MIAVVALPVAGLAGVHVHSISYLEFDKGFVSLRYGLISDIGLEESSGPGGKSGLSGDSVLVV